MVVVASLTVALWAAAAAATPGPDALTIYGPLGVFMAFALPSAVIVYRDQRQQIKDLLARVDRMAAEKDALTAQVIRDVIPVMTRTVQIMTDVHVALQRRGPRDGR